MKTPNLFAMQKEHMEHKEKLMRDLLRMACLLPLLLGLFFMVSSFLKTGNLSSGMFVFCFGGMLTLISLGVVRGQQTRVWKRFTADEVARIERDCRAAKRMGTLLMTQDAVVYLSGGIIVALPIRDIVWIYKKKVTAKKRSIETVTYSVAVTLRDKSTYSVFCKNVEEQGAVDQALDFLQSGLENHRPHVMYGYSDDFKQMYSAQFARMVQLADRGR